MVREYLVKEIPVRKKNHTQFKPRLYKVVEHIGVNIILEKLNLSLLQHEKRWRNFSTMEKSIPEEKIVNM